MIVSPCTTLLILVVFLATLPQTKMEVEKTIHEKSVVCPQVALTCSISLDVPLRINKDIIFFIIPPHIHNYDYTYIYI